MIRKITLLTLTLMLVGFYTKAQDSTNVIYGCMDSTSLNYNPYATKDDGSCTHDTTNNVIYGCMDSTSWNYNPYATIDDGSCVNDTTNNEVYGCMDSTSLNYNPYATKDDGSCTHDTTNNVIYGCMDSTSWNYNPYATIDDGSCVNDTTNNEVYGCMDSSSLNYNQLATKSDGSCFYSTVVDLNTLKVETFGCTDQSATNYDSKANKDNGSCTYSGWITSIPGCMDNTALNYNSKATHNTGNVVPCIYSQDTVFSKIDLSGRTIKQLAKQVNNSVCAFNYLALVEDAKIDDVVVIDANTVQVKWIIIQGGVSFPVTQTYPLTEKVAETIFYLTVSCNVGSGNAAVTESSSSRTFRAVYDQVLSYELAATSSNEVSAYPNPVQGMLNFKSGIVGNVTVEIFNSIGAKVYGNFQSLDEGVNVSSFESGVYFITITSNENKVYQLKVVK